MSAFTGAPAALAFSEGFQDPIKGVATPDYTSDANNRRRSSQKPASRLTFGVQLGPYRFG
jgi:hypothetical protein